MTSSTRWPEAGALLLALAAWGCSGGDGTQDSNAATANSDPRLYWNVELVGTGATKPDRISTDIDRLFDDGRILARMGRETEVALRSSEGTWRTLTPPPPDSSTFGYPTYYEDDEHYGGGSSTGGYLVQGDTFSKCSEKIGGMCEPRGILPDGSVLVVVTNQQGNTYLESWTPGQNDALDVADIFYQANAANGNSAAFARLASDGTILMPPFMAASTLGGDRNTTIVVLRDREPIDLGTSQFNHGEPVDEELERVVGQAVVDVTRSGAILGQKDGRPVLKTGDDYDFVSDERATPIAASAAGDVIYLSPTTGAHYRWRGKSYAFDPNDWSTVAGPLDDPMHLDIVDINASGQVLFYGPPRSGEVGVRLYVATPSKTKPPPKLAAHLTFSGAGAPGKLDTSSPQDVAGSLSSSGLSLTVTGPSEKTKGKARAFNVVITRPSGEFMVGEPLPVTTRVTPDGTLIATVTYADAPTGALAAEGNVTLTQISQQSFTLSVEHVVMKDSKTGASFTVDGYAEAQL